MKADTPARPVRRTRPFTDEEVSVLSVLLTLDDLEAVERNKARWAAIADDARKEKG